VFYGNGNGTFRSPITFPVGGEGVAPTVADFNGDGMNDLLVANYLGDAVVTMLNTGVVSFSPTAPLNFKKQTVGTSSAPQKVTLTNTGKTALAISSMTSTCHASVVAGAKCTISVTFSPQSKGAKSGTVTILDGASSKPMAIELSGTGT
jgi:hypothetical protein